MMSSFPLRSTSLKFYFEQPSVGPDPGYHMSPDVLADCHSFATRHGDYYYIQPQNWDKFIDYLAGDNPLTDAYGRNSPEDIWDLRHWCNELYMLFELDNSAQ